MWFNGDEIPSQSNNTSPSSEFLLDRTNTFGDGVFETMLLTSSGIHLLDLHLERLCRGLNRLGIDCAVDIIRNDIDRALINNGKLSYPIVLKLVVSRGSSMMGYSSPSTHANRLLLLQPIDYKYNKTCELMTCDLRLAKQSLLAGIKHCNRLEQVLLRREVDAAGMDDGIVMDQLGNVIESSCANVFILEQGRLITPPITDCGVAGVMRAYIISRLAPLVGLCVSEEAISLERLYLSDGLFLTNSIQGVNIATSCTQLDHSRLKGTRLNSSPVKWKPAEALLHLQEEVSKDMLDR